MNKTDLKMLSNGIFLVGVICLLVHGTKTQPYLGYIIYTVINVCAFLAFAFSFIEKETFNKKMLSLLIYLGTVSAITLSFYLFSYLYDIFYKQILYVLNYNFDLYLLQFHEIVIPLFFIVLIPFILKRKKHTKPSDNQRVVKQNNFTLYLQYMKDELIPATINKIAYLFFLLVLSLLTLLKIDWKTYVGFILSTTPFVFVFVSILFIFFISFSLVSYHREMDKRRNINNQSDNDY